MLTITEGTAGTAKRFVANDDFNHLSDEQWAYVTLSVLGTMYGEAGPPKPLMSVEPLDLVALLDLNVDETAETHMVVSDYFEKTLSSEARLNFVRSFNDVALGIYISARFGHDAEAVHLFGLVVDLSNDFSGLLYGKTTEAIVLNRKLPGEIRGCAAVGLIGRDFANSLPVASWEMFLNEVPTCLYLLGPAMDYLADGNPLETGALEALQLLVGIPEVKLNDDTLRVPVVTRIPRLLHKAYDDGADGPEKLRKLLARMPSWVINTVREYIAFNPKATFAALLPKKRK